MQNHQHLDRVVIVLVRARNPNNIGAAARAMHDFGFQHLRIVNDYTIPFETAKSAVDASAILAAASSFTSVADAVSDCTLVVGTTAVGERALQHPLLALPQAAATIRSELARAESATAESAPAKQPGRVALLFGSEKTGLSNDELSHCHWLLTIPMHEQEDLRHPSMNLGQAVAVCLYELVRNHEVSAKPEASPSAGELERLTTLLTEVLDKTGYTRRHPANCEQAHIRRLVLRMANAAGDVPAWTGILRQTVWKLTASAPDPG